MVINDEADKRLAEIEEDWICDIVRTTCQNYKGRKIILWGKYGASERIATALEEIYDIRISGYIESNPSKVNDFVFYVPDFFQQADKKEFYIVVPMALYIDIIERLTQSGFEKDVDYCYFSECILEKSEKYYEDFHGNKVIGGGGRAQIIFFGYNSTVIFHENVEIMNAVKIYVYSNAYVEIETNTRIAFPSYVIVRKNAKVNIGANCLLKIRSMLIKPYAELEVGDSTTTEFGTILNICEWSKVKIGKDCMLSHDVKIYSNDAHTIFDLTTGKNINSTKEICQKRNISIGDHVWIGMCATVLYGSEIGNGSIIGAESLVKGVVPDHCIACGIPVKITRHNIAWNRKNCAEDL